MNRRLLVNDCLTCIPGTRTFWHLLQEWFGMEFVGGDYNKLALTASDAAANDVSLIIRNTSWFPPIKADCPQIALLQDIFAGGPQREMQEAVIRTSTVVVFNSPFTYDKYTAPVGQGQMLKQSKAYIIPLPVDFTLFEPQNVMGCQQAIGLPDGGVCWIGASQGAAAHIKGFDVFLSIVRANPDIPFVGVFKDAMPETVPPNLRAFARVGHDELVKIIGACRVGLCTSRMESQHLAGIEMGACGLPVVAPPVGVYWKREQMGVVVTDVLSSSGLTDGIRAALGRHYDPMEIRTAWAREFSPVVVKAAWTKLVEEVECSGVS